MRRRTGAERTSSATRDARRATPKVEAWVLRSGGRWSRRYNVQLCGGVWQDSDQIGQGKYVMAHRLRDAERESSRRAGRRRRRTKSVARVPRRWQWPCSGQRRVGSRRPASGLEHVGAGALAGRERGMRRRWRGESADPVAEG